MRATMVMVSTHLLEIWPQDGLSRALGAAMPDPAGRADHMALLGIRVRSLNGTNALLGANGIQSATVEANHILVSPSETMSPWSSSGNHEVV